MNNDEQETYYLTYTLGGSEGNKGWVSINDMTQAES
jgi:hypothetical protein